MISDFVFLWAFVCFFSSSSLSSFSSSSSVIFLFVFFFLDCLLGGREVGRTWKELEEREL